MVVALWACNQTFGLYETQQIREFFDAPLDAPFTCPAIGVAPEFSTILHQYAAQDCESLTISGSRGRAAGSCIDSSFQSYVYVGPSDGLLVEIPNQPIPPPYTQFPRLTPEGDELFVTPYSGTGLYGNLELHHLYDDGTWSAAIDTHVPTGATPDTISTPTSIAIGRRVLRFVPGDQTLHELLDDGSGTNWVEVASFPIDTKPFGMKLSPDGLRLVFRAVVSTTSTISYADRAAVGTPFNPSVPLVGAPPSGVLDVYMNDDCSRIYFTGVGSMFYEQRL